MHTQPVHLSSFEGIVQRIVDGYGGGGTALHVAVAAS